MRRVVRNFARLFLVVAILAGGSGSAADEKTFYLPQNPVAAAYILKRLSNAI